MTVHEKGRGSKAIYNGTVHDTGSGFLDHSNAKDMTEDQAEDIGDPDAWIDIWLPTADEAFNWGFQRKWVTATFCDVCPAGWLPL